MRPGTAIQTDGQMVSLSVLTSRDYGLSKHKENENKPVAKIFFGCRICSRWKPGSSEKCVAQETAARDGQVSDTRRKACGSTS